MPQHFIDTAVNIAQTETEQMTRTEIIKGLEILASWLEDNINCESTLCFDNPDDGMDSVTLLPCVEAVLKLIRERAN